MSADELLGVAEAAVGRAARRGVTASEAFALRHRSASARIEKNDLGGVESDSLYGIGIRVLSDKRLGFSFAPNLERVDEAVRSALKASRLSKPLPKFSFAAKSKVPRIAGLYDRRVETLDGPDLIETAIDLTRAVHGRDKRLDVTEAGFSFGITHIAVANSEGVRLRHAETSYAGSCFVVQSQKGVSTGFASLESTRLEVEAGKLAVEAADLALSARNPTRLAQGGRLDVVCRPDPSADLVGTITVPSVYGRAAHRDESFYSGKVGRPVAHPKLSLLDDPTMPRGLGSSPFDDEGEASRRFAPIRNGVLKGFLFDRSDAAEYGAKSTGSALRVHAFDGRSHKSPPATSGRNMRLEAPHKSTAKLIASIDEGILVHDMMGVHTANAVSGDFSVTTSLLFRIRKGAVEGPLEPVSVAGNFHGALRHGVVLGDDVKQTSGEASLTLPSVLFETFTVTP